MKFLNIGKQILPSPSQPSSWELKITSIEDVARDIRLFRLIPTEGEELPSFVGGQFMDFMIGSSGENRSYSLVSFPQDDFLAIAIKKIEGGLGSNWFFERKVADSVMAYGPLGSFTLPPELDKDLPLVFLAGGIGITPLYSMLGQLLNLGKGPEAYFFYSAKTEKDLAFAKKLRSLADKHESLYYYPSLTQPEASWPGDRRRATVARLREMLPFALSQARYFICGPAQMNEGIWRDLQDAGVKREMISLEQFAGDNAALEAMPFRAVEITFNGRVYNYSGNQSLLSFLEQQGEAVPSSCRSGTCATCAAKLVAGEVDYGAEPMALTPEAQERGHILTCISLPRTNIRLQH